jgi:hypothetical protein
MVLSNQRVRVVLSVLAAGAAGVLAAGCGVQEHPTASASSAGGDPGGGTGGATFGSGGATNPGGGNPGTGGMIIGPGGAPGSGGSDGSPAGSGGMPGGSGSGGRPVGTGTGGATGAGTGGAPSTIGVTINGKFVPKEKAVTFIHFGHSNMRGQTTSPSSLRPYFFETLDGLWSYKGTFALAKEPTAPEGTMMFGGPGMAILRSAQEARMAGSDAQFISIGYGKGSVTSVDYSKSGSYYPIFMNWASQLKGKVTFAAIVIMLGITERHLPTSQISGFPQRIAQLVSDIRGDLGEPNLPVLFCDYEMEASMTLAPTGSVGTTMIPLIRMLPTVVPKLALVPTDGLAMMDDHHFNLQGHKDWAARVISVMKTNNWFLW